MIMKCTSVLLFGLVVIHQLGSSQSLQINKQCLSNNNPGYTIKVIEETDDAVAVMDFLKRTFFLDEPLNNAVDLCHDITGCSELEEFIGPALLSGLSLKAVNNCGEIVAVTISKIMPLEEKTDGNDLLSQAQRSKNPKFQKILYILAKRVAGAKIWDKFPNVQNMVEIMAAATDSNWRRKGIMTSLVKETETLAVKKNITLIGTGSSSRYSAMAAERSGFTNIYRALYSEIKMNGHPLIVPESPHLEDTFYVKELKPSV